MKHFIIASLLTILGLIVFILVDTETIFPQEKMTVDEEQHGLKEQIHIVFSHVVAENTPKGLAAQKFAELVYEKTGGRVKVEVYPNGILYSDTEELKALNAGEIQMIAPSYSNMTEVVPEWRILDLPFLFRDYDHAKAVFTGETGKELLQFLDNNNMKGLAFWSNGFKQMTSSVHPLREPVDFKNLTFRVMSGDILKRQFQLLGAKPVTASFTDVYSSLENHQFDGQENTISNIYSKGLYQFQPHLTLSNHGYLGYSVIINSEFWNSIPAVIQKQIIEAMHETTLWNMEESKKMNEAQLEKMKEQADISIYELSNDSKARWMTKFQPLYQEVERYMSQELLNQIRKSTY
ncbi:DctP family TRAP transporter solute-binding subunit [Bacillus tuaregi]|uniref:DctP family TRAP transporter solute-binding subunit n=1 Tax=Bacillus tuaregi TaxID=1816695 RepID=UPI0008F92C7D|nr:DctP family TRAP transporter solute-binding subunit [Bacillus tuaregi]